jgi:hypothetical protein
MRLWNLTRALLAGLLAGGVAVASPAMAASGVDLSIGLKGTTIALGASGKSLTVSISNLGTTTPKVMYLGFDWKGLGETILPWMYDVPGCLSEEDGEGYCAIKDSSLIPGPGRSVDLSFRLRVEDKNAARGVVGPLTVDVTADGDIAKGNNRQTVDIVLSDQSGPDLRVIADDAVATDAAGHPNGKPIAPGAKGVTSAQITNFGDQGTAVDITVEAPPGTVFSTRLLDEYCTFSRDLRKATCPGDPDDLTLPPWDSSEKASSFMIAFVVKVPKSAKGPVSLSGGSWTVTPAAANTEPESEVDASDNTDGFHVLIAGPARGDSGNPGPTGGGGGGGDGLPVTGPVAASVAGVGAIGVALGAFLLISARRRRIVAVTPGDEG